MLGELQTENKLTYNEQVISRGETRSPCRRSLEWQLCKAIGAAGVRAGVGVMCVRTWNARVMRRMASQQAGCRELLWAVLCYGRCGH